MIAEELELVPTETPERRRTPRPEPPAPQLAPRMRRLVDWLVDQIESSWKGWVLFAAICLASIAFIYWNMTSRLAHLDQDYTRMVERATLQREFEALAEHYSHDELRKLLDQISSAESSVFADYAALAGWLGEQSKTASGLNLQLSYIMHETVPAQIRNVGEVPISLSIRPVDGQERGAYGRMLEFLRNLVDTRWHLEITDAAVQSDGLAVSLLETTIHVWVDTL